MNVTKRGDFLARKQDENLRPCEYKLSQEEAKKGGIKSGQVRKQKKTVAEYLRKWADGEVSEKNKKALEALGLSEEATNRTLLVVPLIKKASSGDTKALQMALELLGEDKKKELEIKKLRREIELLKAETQKLRMMTGEDREVEDLTALGDMLQVSEDKGDDE